MSAPSLVSNITKAADIAKSLTSDAMRNVPFLIALFLGALFVSLLPDTSLPKELLAYRGLILGVCIFGSSAKSVGEFRLG